MTAEEAAEKYPGLWEAFKEWMKAKCLEHRDRMAGLTYECVFCEHFMAGGEDFTFIDSVNSTNTPTPFPPYLIAIRDMSLV